MIKNLWKNLIVPVILLAIFFITLPIISNELISTILLAVMVIIMFTVKYRKHEWIMLLIGLALGIITELGGDVIYKLQYWKTGIFFGIPLWLPILWAFTIIIIARLGSSIIKEK